MTTCLFNHAFQSYIIQDRLTILPTELFHIIFDYLDLRELIVLRRVNKWLYTFIKDYIFNLRQLSIYPQEKNGDFFEFLITRNAHFETIIIDERGTLDEKRHCYIKDYNLFPLLANDRSCLTSLVLKSSSLLTDVGFLTISYACQQLTILEISNNHNLSSDTLISILMANKKLIYLSLEQSYLAVTDEVLQVLSLNCFNLKTLSLTFCSQVSDAGLLYLTNSPICASIKELSLAHCYMLSSLGFQRLFRYLTNLIVLSLEWCLGVDDDTLQAISKSCQNLEVLGVEHCESLSDLGLSKALAELTKLKFLSVDNCSNFGSLSLSSLSGDDFLIEDIYMNSCKKIDDTNLQQFLNSSFSICSLGIEECGISDTILQIISTNCPNLKTLGLNNNPMITDKGTIKLIKKIQDIERLYLSHTSITNATLRNIACYSKALKSLSVVGCSIDFKGLLYLGQNDYHCAKSLVDLHLSEDIKQEKAFYGDLYHLYINSLFQSSILFNRNKGTKMNKQEDINNLLPFPTFVAHSPQDNLTDLDPMKSKLLNSSGKDLDLEKSIFGSSIKYPYKSTCKVYYR